MRCVWVQRAGRHSLGSGVKCVGGSPAASPSPIHALLLKPQDRHKAHTTHLYPHVHTLFSRTLASIPLQPRHPA